MNSITSLIFLIGVALVSSAPLDAPTNLMSTVRSTSVSLSWDMVDNATGYQVSIVNITDQTTQTNSIEISGLQPRTMYTAMIKAVSDMHNDSMAVEITFTTMIEAVSNLRATMATETSIEISFNAVADATSYNIMFKSLDDVTETEATTTDTSFTLLALSPATFYNIYVSAVTSGGMGDSAMIKARTDGSAVKTVGVWQNEAMVFGGQIMVLRPLTIPKGPYTIEITIPCLLDSINVWNGEVDETMSDVGSGVLLVTQSTSWQRRASDIGVTFNAMEGFNCSFGVQPASAVFGIDLPDTTPVSTTPVPIVVNEWLNQTEFEVFHAGLVRVRLDELYQNTNEESGSGDLDAKPSVYTFVVALKPGLGCASGVDIREMWSMTEKNVEGIEGTLPGVKYFIQNEKDWYSNEAGFIYGYNPEFCGSRTDLSAEVMIGGNLVEAIIEAPDAKMMMG